MIPTIPGNTSPPVRVQGTDFGRTIARPLALSAAALVPILVALDLAYGALLRTSMPATSREALGAIVLDLAVVLVLVLTLALAQLMAFRVAFWLQQRRGDRVLIVAAVLLSTPVIYLLARQPFIGNRYRGTPVALYGPWVLLPILAAGAALLLWLALRAIRTLHDPATPRGKRTLLLAALGGTALGIFAVDATWYVGWYPLIHTIFSLSVALLLQLIASALLWRRGTPFVIDRRRLAIGGFALAALADRKSVV